MLSVRLLIVSGTVFIQPIRKSGARVFEKVPSAMVSSGSKSANAVVCVPSYLRAS